MSRRAASTAAGQESRCHGGAADDAERAWTTPDDACVVAVTFAAPLPTPPAALPASVGFSAFASDSVGVRGVSGRAGSRTWVRPGSAPVPEDTPVDVESFDS